MHVLHSHFYILPVVVYSYIAIYDNDHCSCISIIMHGTVSTTLATHYICIGNLGIRLSDLMANIVNR